MSSDELVLALVGLVRAVNPRLLQQGPDGFTVDLDPIEKKIDPSADERLLLKLRAILDAPEHPSVYELDLGTAESLRLVWSIERLEKLREWPPDVLALSRSLRARLTASSS